ncbi:MAG: DUF5916 domain-containing protein [Gemmatimonadota bacterium]
MFSISMLLVRGAIAAALASGATPAAGRDFSPAQDTTSSHLRTVTIPRIEAEAQIDGVMDEPVWQQATRLSGFHQYQPVDSRPAEEETEVLVWYAPHAIYFGIIAHDKTPAAIHATVADRDNLDADDRVTIYLDTFNDRRRAFMFGVNPLGSQKDGVRTEGGFTAGSLTGGTTDLSPDYLWESKGRITPEGYVVEIRIPFKSLRYPGGGQQEWGINIVRDVQRTGYEDTWTDTRRANASFLLQSGTMNGLHDLQRGVTTEIQPFVTANSDGVRDPATNGFDRNNLAVNSGVNLRLGLTSSLSVDATYNPDFSTIESDASQVTANERFALFFPEKRPFFLEGIELFATPNQLVYTRQIGNPIAGGKITTKIGRTNVAYLSALDEHSGPDAFFNVARLRRDIGANSTAGLTVTSRGTGGDYNRMVASDARIVFGKLYYVAGQLGASWTKDAIGNRAAPLWDAEFDRTGRAWGFNYHITGFGRDFEAQSGFVPRNDIVQAHAFNRFTWYGSRGAFLESFQTFFGPNRLWRYEDFGRRGSLEGSESTDISLRMRGGWNLTNHLEHNFVNFLPGDYSSYTIDQGGGTSTPYPVPSGVQNGFLVSSALTTPVFQVVDANLKLARSRGAIFPEASTGYQTRVTGGFSLRPTGSVRIGTSLTLARITRARDGSEFARTIIPRIKTEYQPNRALFFRLVAEYVSSRQSALVDARNGQPLLVGGAAQPYIESNRLRLDWLASFEPVPGTVAFFGYGASLDEPTALTFRHFERTADGFFVKVAYQIRR